MFANLAHFDEAKWYVMMPLESDPKSVLVVAGVRFGSRSGAFSGRGTMLMIHLEHLTGHIKAIN